MKPASAADAGPALPHEIAYLWDWFCDLVMGVASGGFGVSVATWSDICDWSIMMNTDPEIWEVRMLARLSIIRADVLEDKNADKRKKK